MLRILTGFNVLHIPVYYQTNIGWLCRSGWVDQTERNNSLILTRCYLISVSTHSYATYHMLGPMNLFLMLERTLGRPTYLRIGPILDGRLKEKLLIP